MDARGRASASRMMAAQGPVGIRPFGSLDQASRQAAGWSYSGVLAGSAPIAVPTINWTLPVRSANWTLEIRDTSWQVASRDTNWTLEIRDTSWQVASRDTNWTLEERGT